MAATMIAKMAAAIAIERLVALRRPQNGRNVPSVVQSIIPIVRPPAPPVLPPFVAVILVMRHISTAIVMASAASKRLQKHQIDACDDGDV